MFEAAGNLFVGWLPMGSGVVPKYGYSCECVCVPLVSSRGTKSLFTRLLLKM